VDHQETRIRPYQPSDLDDLYRICLLTGRKGQDATSLYSDPQLPGHVYAAPYGLFEPSLAFVAQDAAGVGGYVLGALDSQAFERRLERAWWPGLRLRYPEPTAVPEQQRTPDQRIAHRIHHPWHTHDELAGNYPSHLHIDLVPRLQARGNGSRLIRTLLAALRAQGSPGVHLHVSADNRKAVGFYRHLGFAELSATPVGLNFGMDLRGD
jgi:ribosomal protein S18 acetylase RimI-like enzyme